MPHLSEVVLLLLEPLEDMIEPVGGLDTIDLEPCEVTEPGAWAEPGTESYKASANMLSQTIKTLLNISRFFSSLARQ